jgi:hypothetical protein
MSRFAGVVIIAAITPGLSCPVGAQALEVAWTGKGEHRALVRVEPGKLVQGRTDQRPAALEVDFDAELKKLGAPGVVDMGSIQVIRYDAATGKPLGSVNYAHGFGPFDCPFCWYDAAIEYEFPEFSHAVSSTDGQIRYEPRTRGGYFFNAAGDWRAGRLVWMHAASDERPAHYAVYFDLLPAGAPPPALPPAAWVGDGTPRRDKIGGTTFGADHCRIDLDDWNGDGLVDVIVGEQYGHVLVWPNLGTKSRPEFRYGRFVLADGKPLDAGMGAVPKVVDWDGDGALDLLVGTEWNRILFYRNAGTNLERKLEYRGPLAVNGAPLELPIQPLTRGSPEIFKRDYYPNLETIDWDGDGGGDLLAGGYITGMIFFYENVGKSGDGTPQLVLRGPLETDGKAINVRYWCASPCAADLDGDGDLDLLSGNFPMYVRAGDKEETDFLLYYENIGSRTTPVLVERPLPAVGTRPHARLATPRLADWDNDGDLDLAASSRENLYLFENKGSRTKPQFQMHAEPVTTPWGLADIATDQFRDWNGDGRLDLVQNYTVRLNSGNANPFAWRETVSVLPQGAYIAHPSGIGDDWFWPNLDDFDRDGRIDVLFGDWWGHVWLHRNLSTHEERRFDVQGFRLKLADGAPIKVGPIGKDIEKDFDALQGARTVFTTADFDRDGARDLVVGDTYGKIRYFHNLGPRQDSAEPTFAPGVEIANLGIRGLVAATDWNADGWPDVVASAANGRVRVLINRQQRSQDRPFDEGFDPKLPPIVQPRVLVADINGDGDDDLFLPSTQGSCFIERSFLEAGYARGELLAMEQERR